jgi:type II secretion system protein N
MSSVQKYIAYALYIIGVAVFFLYILFPSDTLKTYIEYKTAELSPGIGMHIEKINPGLPPGITFSNAHILFMDESVVRFDRGRLSPAFLSMFSAKPAVNFDAAVSGGQVDGRLAGSLSGMPGIDARVQFSAIELQGLPILEKLYPARFSGTARGNVDYSGKGNATLNISGFRMDFDKSMMGIGHLDFSSINVEGEIEKDRMIVEKIEMTGSQFSATGNGTLTLRQPLEASRIDLSGSVEIHPQLIRSIGPLLPRQYLRDGKIPVRITGTLAQPQYLLR